MKIKNIKFLLFVFLSLPLMFTSCDNSDKNDGIDFLVNDGTKAEQFAGDWYVTFTLNNVVQASNKKIQTFNTAANEKNSFWVMDDVYYGFQIKLQGQDDLTFTGTDGVDIKYGNEATISNGKILLDVAKSKTGNATDSIYMEVIFASDPTDTWIIAGHKRTRWPEDDY